MKTAVLGTGGWGIALGLLLADNANEVTLWSKFQSEIDELSASRESKKLLPGVKIPETIRLTSDVRTVGTCDAVILCVPSFAIADVCALVRGHIRPDALVINAGKGLEPKTGKRFSEVISESLGRGGIVVISGPTHAEEVARRIPTSIVASSKDAREAKRAQDLLMSEYMRVYVNDDVIGVEFGGALKNIIALCAGICDGLGLGDNTKAALITRGLAEITRLGVAMGGRAETFMGLTGIGDLVVTCCSRHSRNHRAGELIGKGLSMAEAVERVGTVEGFFALETAKLLSEKAHVEMPIIEKCHDVLSGKLSARRAVCELFARPKTSETGI